MQILEEKLPVLSKRAEIKRAEVLNWYFAGYKDNDQVYSLTKRQADLSNKFKRENDSSYYDVVSIDNHILICIDTEKYDEALEYCQKLIQQRKALSLYHEIGFVWGVIRKSMVYIIMGNAPKAIEFLEDKESQLLQILNIKNQAPGVRAYRAYIITKLCALFINKRYREAWLFLNKHSSDLAQNKSNIPNIEMMQLLIQYEMGNYDLLQSMVRRAQTQVRKIEGDDSPLLHYLNFFKQASQYKGPNLGLIKKTISSMEKNAASKVTGCFGLLAYYDWLKSKAETE